MKTAKATGDYVVNCPHCDKGNEVSQGDTAEEFCCQYLNCLGEFIVGKYESEKRQPKAPLT